MPDQSLPAFPPLIDQQADLDRVCDLLDSARLVAVDTEFTRVRTYAPQLGLVQLGIGETTVCIDPLADMDLAALWERLFDPARESILHAAKQDMEVFWFETGRIIPTLSDTQVFAGLLGLQPQIGHTGLVAELLDIDLGKSQARTDWAKRPLSAAQLKYAAADVEHLEALHSLLLDRLDEAGRLEWAREDCAALTDPALYTPDPASAWQRIKSVPFMAPEAQARARVLAEWREERAVKLDKPRQWILSDKALLALAAENPSAVEGLNRIDDLPPATIRKQGHYLIELLKRGDALYEQQPDEFVRRQREHPDEVARNRALMKKVKARAKELGIAPEVLASKRDLTQLIQNEPGARLLSGWRWAVIGEELREGL